MPDFLGTDFQIAIQKRLQKNHEWIKDEPELSNGGRILNVLEPQKISWPRIINFANQDNCVSLTAQPLEPTLLEIREHFGPEWDTIHWDVFLGGAPQVLGASQAVCDSFPLPENWRVETYVHPTDDQIEEIQLLNQETGIAASPAWYMRSDIISTMTAVVRDETGKAVATAMANYRYHHKSRFADHIFLGSVSVLPEHRGKQLGNLVSAATLVKSHEAFGWKTALSQVRSTNIPSRRMIESCGLTSDNGLATIAVIEAGQQLTR